MYKKTLLFLILIFTLLLIFTGCGDPGGGSGDDDDDTTLPGDDDDVVDVDTTAPATLHITAVTEKENSVEITWDVPSDSDFDHAVVNCSNGSDTDVTGVSVEVTGLSSDTEYEFTVNAVDTSGNVSEDVYFKVHTTTGAVVGQNLIYTADGLDDIRNDLSGVYHLMADIDLSAYSAGEGWVPIGNNSFTQFTGEFHGNGHVISNLFIKRPSNDYQGFFGYMNSGEVYNLGIENCDVTGQNYTGGLVGYGYYETVTNCYATGSVTGSGTYTGGLVGGNCAGTITGCYVTCSATVTGIVDYVGGLAGYTIDGTITDCYAAGSVSGSAGYTGGLVGYKDPFIPTIISNCFYDEDITGQSDTGKGTPKTTAEMKTQSTFTDAGWDFTDTWAINSSINSGYPYLQDNMPQ